MSVKIGDKLYTDTVQSMTYHSPEPVIYRDMKWWESLLRHRYLRRAVPARFRQPIKPVREGKSSTVTVHVGKSDEAALQRHLKTMEQVQAVLDSIR